MSLNELTNDRHPACHYNGSQGIYPSELNAQVLYLKRCSHAHSLYRAFVTSVSPILEYASVIRSPYHVNETNKLESVQRRFTKRIAGLCDLPYIEWIAAGKSRNRKTSHLFAINLYQVLFGLTSVDWSSLFAFNPVSITRGQNRYKLHTN
jgi:hypothetical protein